VRLRVLTANYLRSGPTCAALGPAIGPEIAFVGRSNVGKSSLLNALTGSTSLVRTSKTPGQTRSVNLFEVDLGRVSRSGEISERRKLVFADLPGYGFAHASKNERAKLSRLLSHYLTEREGLMAVVHLFDARHKASAQDVEVFQEVASLNAEHILVATKADKVAVSKRKLAKKDVTAALGIPPEGVLLFSSETGIGRETLLVKLWDLAA
jgi:GTP-binding protein